MAVRGNRPQILLDWTTVSYRSIMRGVVYLVLALALGGIFYYLKAARRSGPGELALQEIGRAERMYEEASSSASDDPRVRRIVESAGKLLDAARTSYGRQDYDDARATAQQSQSFARKVLDGAGGDAFTAQVYRYEGDVKIKRARQFVWNNVNASMALRVGDQIKTASNGSAQIIYFDGTITTIKPGSLLEIRGISEDPATHVRKVSERLDRGGVSASMPGTNVAGSFHEITTESATARATTRARFEVDYDFKTRRTRTEVHSGRAEVKVAGSTITLKPRERLEVDRNRVVRRQRLLRAPTLFDPSDQRVFVVSEPRNAATTLRWAKVKGAARYRLQIARTGLFGSPLLDKRDVRSTSVKIPGLREGNYYWRVSAFDRNGVESAFSGVRAFKVVSARQQRPDDAVPPKLEVTEFLPTGHLVIINGRTEPGAVLTMDGQKIDVYDDGTFTAVLRMKKEGFNQIEIVAQDPAGNTTRARKRVYVEAY
ncbi:MAG: FecR domain-containing protein [Acidobacteriota bacterium]